MSINPMERLQQSVLSHWTEDADCVRSLMKIDRVVDALCSVLWDSDQTTSTWARSGLLGLSTKQTRRQDWNEAIPLTSWILTGKKTNNRLRHNLTLSKVVGFSIEGVLRSFAA